MIPAYNAERVIRRALDSVMRQTASPGEVVVVDDGSVDGTGAILHRYGDRVTRIRQENGGVSAARNRGILAATREWVAFLDADDEWFPEKLERQAGALAQSPDSMWCATNMMLVRSSIPVVAPIPAGLERCSAASGTVHYFTAAMGGLHFQTSGMLVRRRVFAEVGLFDTTLRVSEDRDMWWRIAMRYPHIAYCLEACYRYHEDTPGSLTKETRDRSASLRSVCDNMRRARSLGPDVSRTFERYGRALAMDYLRRAASGEIELSPSVARDAEDIFTPTLSERLILSGLRHLPRTVAVLLAERAGRPAV